MEVNERPKMKISEDPKKTTVPGRKDIYRLTDAEGEKSKQEVPVNQEQGDLTGLGL